MPAFDRAFAIGLVVFGGLLGCDSSVALDTTQPRITKAIVWGACSTGVENPYDALNLSIILEDITGANADPEFIVMPNREPLVSLLRPESFTFVRNSDGVDGTLPQSNERGATATSQGADGDANNNDETENISF